MMINELLIMTTILENKKRAKNHLYLIFGLEFLIGEKRYAVGGGLSTCSNIEYLYACCLFASADIFYLDFVYT